jgi:hypothetical protein
MSANTVQEIKARLKELSAIEEQVKHRRVELRLWERQLLLALIDESVDELPKHLWGPDEKAPSHQVMASIIEIAQNFVKLDEIKDKVKDEQKMLTAIIQGLQGGTDDQDKGDK